MQERAVPEAYSCLKVTMFHRANDFPLLKGKAREVRYLLEPMLDVCLQFLNNAVKVHAQIVLALRKLIDLEDILGAHPTAYRLPGATALRFKQSAEAFVGLNAALRRYFEGIVYDGKPALLFHVTIKYHYMLHIADMALYLNPRLGWCYSGESLMHRVRTLIQASCRGVEPHKLADKVMKKYEQALAMELSREREDRSW